MLTNREYVLLLTYAEIVTVDTDSGLKDRRVGRYILQDLVADSGGTSTWRAEDPALRRPVSIRLLSLDDPRAEDVRAGALQAARVVDRRLAKVLDVVETDGRLAVVSEWVSGTSWSELLNEQWSLSEAVVVALEVARALEVAHELGVAHGRLRPNSVMITDTKEVRLRGLGVDRVLYGSDVPDNAKQADIFGVGALLYVGATRRWPADQKAPVDGLRTIQPTLGVYPNPSTLAADVSSQIDTICRRAMRSSAVEPGFATIHECARELDAALLTSGTGERVRDDDETSDSRTDKVVGRLSTVAIFVFALTGIGLLCWQLFINLASESQPSAAVTDTGAAGIPPVELLEEQSFAISAARAFDPQGDGTENDDQAKNAIDGSKRSAWYTSAYPNANMYPKGGVGLLLDLGTLRQFRALDLKLVGSSSDFQILASRKKHAEYEDFNEIVPVTAAGDSIKVRAPSPVKARYVLVWFTELPYDGANYIGGIRDAKIVG